MHLFAIAVLVLQFDYFTRIDADSNIELTVHKEFVPFVVEVQNYFKASSIVVISDVEDEGIYATTIMTDLIHEFSRRSVSSAIISFSDLQHYYRRYSPHKIRPLIVVLLNNVSSMEGFQRISSQYPMSEALWLVIFADASLEAACHQPPGNYFHLTFDTEMLVKCKGDKMFREWYAFGRNRTKIYDFATWDAVGQKLKMVTNKSLYERRRNLHGSLMRLAIIKDSPYITLENGNLTGFFAMILRELGESINFKRTIAYEEMFYGSYDETTKNWSGVMGRLTRGEVDVGLDEFTMTERRLGAVDFSLPILQLDHQIFMKRVEKSNLHWSGYFQVYTVDVWIAMHLMFILTSIIITLMTCVIKAKPLKPEHFTESYFYVWGICWQQALPHFPSAWPLRIAYCSILMKAMIMYAIYSACLISFLTVSGPNVPFASLADFADDGSYKLITFQHGAHYELMTTSKDPLMQRVAKLMPEPVFLPDTLAEGFRQSCLEKVAFYATGLIKSQVNRFASCELASLKTGGIDSIGLTLPKKSQFTRIINHNLQRFREVGIMDRLKSQMFLKQYPPGNEYHPVNFEEIVTILSILLAGLVISLIVLLLEIIVHQMRSADSKGNEHKKSVILITNARPSRRSIAFDYLH